MLAPEAPLTDPQRELLDLWLPGARFLRDHGWGLVQTTVLEVSFEGKRLIVKAGGPSHGHIAREIRAHREWLAPWTTLGRAPELLHWDEATKIVVTRYLPGTLVQGDPSVDDPSSFRQAGSLLALLHGQTSVADPSYEERENAKTLGWLDGPHRIPTALADEVRSLVRGFPAVASVLVPTHGDWQPRNWLVHDGVVSVIDLGRSALRPAYTDLARLATRDFVRDPALEAAFLEGYGQDPRGPGAWWRTRVREAVGSAAWAFQVGDEGFEHEGLAALEAAVSSR